MTRYRPTGVSVIAILSFIYGFLSLAGALVILAIPLPDPFGRFTLVFGLVLLIVAALYLLMGWGLWELREWARLAVIVISALSLVSNLVSGVMVIAGVNVGGVTLGFPGVGAGALIQAAIAAFILYYLARADVREAFQGPRPELEPARIPTEPVISEPVVHLETELIAKPSLPTAWLVQRRPGLPGREFRLQAGRSTIGRDGTRCQVTLDDPTVSNEHAAIVFENGRFVLYDLASTNGTYLNSQRILRQMLFDNDEIRLGNSVLVFKKV